MQSEIFAPMRGNVRLVEQWGRSCFNKDVMKFSHCTDAARVTTDSFQGLLGGSKPGDGKDEFRVQWSPPQDCSSAPPSPGEHKTDKVS